MSNGIVNGTDGLESRFGEFLRQTLRSCSHIATFFSVSRNQWHKICLCPSSSEELAAGCNSNRKRVSSPLSSVPHDQRRGLLTSMFCRNGWHGPNGGPPSGPPARGGYNSYSNRSQGYGGGGREYGGRGGWDSPRDNSGWSGGGGGGGRGERGQGRWADGKHVVGPRDARVEKELYGDPQDPTKQHTGINFEKYDDIPVEATGAGVPEPVNAFTNPPLDPVLLENITFARYTTPTPVQKYSIPIVAGNRDLMACAQVSTA